MMNKQNFTQTCYAARHTELLILSRSYNGYTREEAVIELENYPSEKTIDALLERVNDWVPEIRRVAQYAIMRICKRGHTAHLIKQLGKIYHLKECRRDNHSAFVDSIEQLLTKQNVDTLLHLSSCNNRSAVLYAKLLKRRQVVEFSQLITVCAEHSLSSVRQYALTLSSALPETERKKLLLRCIGDKSGIVRRDALRLLLKLAPELGNTVSKQLLYDKEKSVRSQALFYLKNHSFDCKKELIGKLNTENLHQQRIAIWGLTEIFAKESVNLILPLLDSSYPSIRTLALKACFVLCEEDALQEVFNKMLNDSSPRVIKECANLYKKCNVVIDEARIKEAILNQKEEKNYRFILKMTQKTNKWDQLILLSKISHSSSLPLQEEVDKTLQVLAVKLRSYFIDPTMEQVKKIENLSKREKQYWTPSIKQAIRERESI